jgi:hypothetical protein
VCFLQTFLQTFLQGVPPMLCGLDRSWSRDAPTQPPSNPALLYSLGHLEEQLKAAYKLVTEGKFSEALRVFVRMLQVRRNDVAACVFVLATEAFSSCSAVFFAKHDPCLISIAFQAVHRVRA